jgi:hypothetical protein
MIVQANRDLSRGDLVVYIRGEDGGFIDPFAVTYTVLDQWGAVFSGEDLPALWQSPGTYYAPVRTSFPNGPYVVRWGIRYSDVSTLKYSYQNIFNLDPAVYHRLNSRTTPPQLRPDPQSKTYLTGYTTGPDDLAVYFSDLSGVRFDPYAVFASVREKSGRVTRARIQALKAGLGHFWTQYRVTGITGDYAVLWEYSRYMNDPLQSKLLPFSQLNPANPSIGTDVDSSCDCVTDCNKALTGCTCECTKTHASFGPGDC